MNLGCKILLADDHKVVLHGLRRILDGPEFEVVGTVRDGRALIDAFRKLKPDIIIADVSMPLLNGIEAVCRIRKHNPQAKIIFLTMHPEAIYAMEAMKAGASGYLVKTADEEELISAVRKVRDGGIYITPQLEEVVMNSLQAPRKSARRATDALTTRQREVLQLLAEGKQPKEIGALLNISYRTVEFHKYRIMATLGLKTVPALAAYAAKQGIVS
jgi:DNA-binding NarL/FixJ family response regulator